MKTKVPGNGQQREVEGGEGENYGSLIWVRGQHKAKAKGPSLRMTSFSCPSLKRIHIKHVDAVYHSLPHIHSPIQGLLHNFLPHSCASVATKEEPEKGKPVRTHCGEVQTTVIHTIIATTGRKNIYITTFLFKKELFPDK